MYRKEVQPKFSLLSKLSRLLGRLVKTSLLMFLCLLLLAVALRGNQPMRVDKAPAGMTYFEFISGYIKTARTMEPAHYGWGMLLSLAVLGPLYTTVYTIVGIHPEGSLARVTAPDPGIPQGVTGAAWYQVPEIWWETLERLSYAMLETH